MGKLTHQEVCHLINEIKSGSEAAFETMYETYMPFIYSIAIKIVKRRQEAEDICHDVFLDFLRSPERYDPERGSLESWLAIKTKSKCLDLLRAQKRSLKQKHEQTGSISTALYDDPTLEWTLSLELKEMVSRALEQIPSPQRHVLQQVYFQGLTQRSIAAQMNRPLGTVKSLIRYGLKNMKKQLKQWEESEAEGGK